MNYHTIIAVENRKPTVNPDGSLNKSRLAIPITTFIQTGVDANGFPVGTTSPPQLHSMGSSISDINNPNLLYVASWDGISPWVVIPKGSIAGLNMQFAGWPMIDKATYMDAVIRDMKEQTKY